MNLKLRHHPTKRGPKKLADNNLFSKRNNNNYYSLQYQLSCFLKPAELPWWKNIPFSCHRKTQCQTWGLRLMQIFQKAYFQCRPPLMHICEFCCLLKERFFELTGTKCPETVGSTSIIWNLFVFQIMRNKPFLPMLICKFSLKRLFQFSSDDNTIKNVFFYSSDKLLTAIENRADVPQFILDDLHPQLARKLSVKSKS